MVNLNVPIWHQDGLSPHILLQRTYNFTLLLTLLFQIPATKTMKSCLGLTLLWQWILQRQWMAVKNFVSQTQHVLHSFKTKTHWTAISWEQLLALFPIHWVKWDQSIAIKQVIIATLSRVQPFKMNFFVQWNHVSVINNDFF